MSSLIGTGQKGETGDSPSQGEKGGQEGEKGVRGEKGGQVPFSFAAFMENRGQTGRYTSCSKEKMEVPEKGVRYPFLLEPSWV